MASEQLLTSGANAADATSYSTASVAPTADALVLLALVTRTPGTGAGVQLPSSVAGAGLTFDLVEAIAYDDGDHCVSLWRAMTDESPGSGPITMSNFGAVQARAVWNVWEVTGLPAEVMGDNGANAIRNVSKGASTHSAMSVAFGEAFANSFNWCFAAFGTGGTLVTTTPGSGWTEIADQAAGELTAALHTEYRPFKAATADMTASASCAFGGIALEIVTVPSNAIDLAQDATMGGAANIDAFSLEYAEPTTPGNTLVALVSGWRATGSGGFRMSSVPTDSYNNTWQRVVEGALIPYGSANPYDVNSVAFICVGANGGANHEVTFDPDGTGNSIDVTLLELTGVDEDSPVAGVARALSGGSATANPATGSLSQQAGPGHIQFAISTHTNNAGATVIAASPPWLEIQEGTNNVDDRVFEHDYRVLADESQDGCSWTLGSGRWNCVSFALRAAGEDELPFTEVHDTAGGENILVLVPKTTPNGRAIVYHHGMGGGAEQLLHPLFLPFALRFAEAGYIVAGSDLAGDNFGNSAALAAGEALHQYLVTNYNVTGTVLLSASMGGLSGLLEYIGGNVPNIRGWIGIFPAIDLAALYDAFEWTADAIDAAYPGYPTSAEGHNPMEYPPSAFAGKRFRIYASETDSLVDFEVHAQAFADHVKDYALEAEIVVIEGEHGETYDIDIEDGLAFIERAFASEPAITDVTPSKFTDGQAGIVISGTF